VVIEHMTKKSVLNLFLISSCHWTTVFPMLCGNKVPIFIRMHCFCCMGGFHLPECVGILKIPYTLAMKWTAVGHLAKVQFSSATGFKYI